ncbi:hypothetical protein F4808DRAFT_449802 [Astrocystis sublimbata]|nr:hypothetical protein F4808DRAFT_449802 [Astrocystis sublimbata]
MKLGPSKTLAVLRVSQGILSTLTSLSLAESLVLLQWSLIGSNRGLPYLDLLALSPTNGVFGALSLLCSSVTKGSSKKYALLRLSLVSLVWISGIVLFFNTSLTTVYDTASTYAATAGIGPFNASLIEPFMANLRDTSPGYPYRVVPFSYFAAVYTLVLNPLVSTLAKPVACRGVDCASYLLSGGLEYVAPWVPAGNDSHGLVRIDMVPSLQLDFETPSSAKFLDEDCENFGDEGILIGIRLCLAQTHSPLNLIRAGLFVCLNGTDGDNCGGHEPRPNITTSMAVYTRHATIVAARSNYSIVDVADLSPPKLLPEFDLKSYRLAMNWLLNYSAAAIPAPSSIIQPFWSSPEQLSDPSTYGILSQSFQSILAFPFWLFNSNNWGNVHLISNQITPFQPPEFYTQASIVAPYDKIRFNKAMFALFLAFQGLAMVFTWAVLVWLWLGPRITTEMSAWTVFDMTYKTRVRGGGGDVKYHELGTADVIGVMKTAQVHRRELG